jgi:hypothetical protein
VGASLVTAADTTPTAADGLQEGDRTVPYVFALPQAASDKSAASGAPRPVPEVRGLSVREAVRALHRAGFRVQLAGFGAAASTRPSAGSLAQQGALVRLVGTP